MIDELSPKLPPQLVNGIRAGLLRIHSKKLDGKAALNSCLKDAYNVFAGALVKDGQMLTDDLLGEVIPEWISRWCRVHSWLGPWLYKDDDESYVSLGETRVPALVRKQILSPLASRIAYWKAVALNAALEPASLAAGGFNDLADVSPELVQAPQQDTETPKEVVARLRAKLGYTNALLAVNAKIGEKTIYRLCRGINLKPGTRKNIAEALGCDPDALRWKLHKTGRKRFPKKTAK